MDKQKILIIEDDKEIRSNLQTLFKINGFEAFCASDGDEGIVLAKSRKPDLILCDIMMNQVDGYEVIKAIRADSELLATPFIFLSGKAESDELRYGMELGADDYIFKPFINKEVVASVRSRLSKHADFKKHYEEKIDKLQKTLISAIPHEYKTPIHSILGFSYFLKENINGVQTEDAKKMLDNIYKAGRRLLNLFVNFSLYNSLSNNFDYSQYKDATVEEPRSVIYSELVNVSEAHRRIDEYTTDLADAEICIYQEHFSKIVYEIIDNAFKFSPPRSKVKISSKIEDGFYVIKVVSLGRILKSRDLAQVGAFVQFERELYEQQGAGLGLTVAALLASMYGGSVNIDSDEVSRTVVEIKLKIKE
jgi:DNA-binding response OmpR family regulator